MSAFIGHFHPILVHLPIGILLLACLFIWQSRRDKYEHLGPVINTILFWGMISAFFSCISGYLLAQSGEYDQDLVSAHQWLGISVAIVSTLMYFSRKASAMIRWQGLLGVLLLLLLFITGHLGGSLTHGSDYLTQPLKSLLGDDTIATLKRKPIANIQEAMVYSDIIEPVLQEKCYSCHGAEKQKGKLRMDQPELLMKGGKDGVVIIAGKPGESELIKRILLPREEEKHMAPKEKPQLTEQEIALLQWWIAEGADFTKKVKDIIQPEKIKILLTSLQGPPLEKNNLSDVPAAPVERVDDGAIEKLRSRGVVVVPVAQNSNYLEADFVTASGITDHDMALLLPLKKQLVWLKAGHLSIGDTAMQYIGQCSNLIKLQLDHTHITDIGLNNLKSLSLLQALNLTGTEVTAAGIKTLTGLKQLHFLYLYQTSVDRAAWMDLKKIFPKMTIDSGGYNVPILESDTTLVKPPKK